MTTAILSNDGEAATGTGADLLATLHEIRDRLFKAADLAFAQRDAYLDALVAGDARAAQLAKAVLERTQADVSALKVIERRLEAQLRDIGVEPPAPDLRLMFRYFPASGALRCTERCDFRS